MQALLEQQLTLEKSKMETEKKKFQNALDDKVSFLLLYTPLISIYYMSES